MSPLEDASKAEQQPPKGEVLVTRCILSAQFKEDDINNIERKSVIIVALLISKFVV